MKDLKPKEQRVLNFIRESIMLNGYAPSVRDICAALDIKSTSTVHLYLRKLEEKGYIDRCDGKSRAIRVDERQPAEERKTHIKFRSSVRLPQEHQSLQSRILTDILIIRP